MIIVLKHGSGEAEIKETTDRLTEHGFKVHLSQGVEKTLIGAIGDRSHLEALDLEALPWVEKVVAILAPYKLVSREFHPSDSIIKIGDHEIGGSQIHVMAGPCAVESRSQLLETAHRVREAGATFLRGGAFKPRTSPYAFQGLGEEGLRYMAEAREETGLLIVTEVMDVRDVELVASYADVLQIGARNMQNFYLLKEVAKVDRPVLLKRGPSSTLEEWMMAAEYIMDGGNYRVMFCERGIRTFEEYTRNTLDLSMVPALHELSHLPVIVDPSHGTGRWNLVAPMAKAALAAGADGLIVEVHPQPEKALSDGKQSLTPENFRLMMRDLSRLAQVLDRELKGAVL
ncbi:3-deoxy-8-phosphooctulonate synthase/3-deoxy-7-phosphoheptulonate synthase [Acididesulfobacillus acetoxydans]|uniref:3-deoxy-8-phosphooctulonate synthase/3-deoxy-7-phosphoheptulonate synthase n=1 Tax=Acididesulfobacillus acetoxydans TaxID=1561005 RepID=A0A8S0WZM3_9FIRM|nr:3-deoxy-7-phosphoheptulonate synthase [Acididesulfobacillus acetoxydans]CAA7602041.1 3-deoxy-8-phosphooctulonate synthase/3-deoxy-7-phosphoheptulonate synthase [Acididesulfobacillus acetoxydans]CEJ08116.1 Phospho-2-dehydro-3-deoxyheptonate aldolase [Acididesulfobacillus acetoxydans]